MNNFDRDFKRTSMIVNFGIGFVFCVIIAMWIGGGVLLYRAATDPEGIGSFIGRVIGGAQKGYENVR